MSDPYGSRRRTIVETWRALVRSSCIAFLRKRLMLCVLHYSIQTNTAVSVESLQL